MAKLPKGSEVPTIVEGAEDGATFKVEVSAHLMALLAGLYSNREDSIVREVLCNAYDAQISIGVDAPVVIEVPTEAKPTLVIRDQGPGMSRATVFKVYASYGTSTKGDSDEQTGGMGVGAKSVFCYTDTFTVVSWHNGVEATYVAYLNGETGIPRIDLMAETACSPEKTGIEVQVPVQREDITTFNAAIRWNSQFHPTPPTIIGGAPVECAYDVAPLELDLAPFGAKGWFAYPDWADKAGVPDNRPKNGVSMGSVLYPLTPPQMKLVPGLSVMFKCPMGAVRFAPSREVLKYDEVTVANLKKAGEAYSRAYAAWVNGLIVNAETRDPGLLGEQVKQLNLLTTRKWDRVLDKCILSNTLGDGIANRFYPRRMSLHDIGYRVRGVNLMYFDDQGIRRSAASSPSLGKGVVLVEPLLTECWVARGTAGESRIRYADKCKVFFVKEESEAIALAAYLGLRAENFIRYTDELEAPPARPKMPKGRITGKLLMYSKLAGYSAGSTEADEALETSGGVFVESLPGGHDWLSTSTSLDKTLTKRRYSSDLNLDIFDSQYSWVTDDVQMTNVLRLNQGDREKLERKGIPLLPWAEQALNAIDFDEIRRLHRAWVTLGLQYCKPSASRHLNPVAFMHNLVKLLDTKLQSLLVDALNTAKPGTGDLLEESLAAAAAGLGKHPGANEGLLDKLWRLLPEEDPARNEPELDNLLRGILGATGLMHLSLDTAEQRKGAALAALTALKVPDAVISRALGGELTVVPKRKAKAAVVPEGQLKLFEEEASAAEAPALRVA